jgi:hypothetical protein
MTLIANKLRTNWSLFAKAKVQRSDIKLIGFQDQIYYIQTEISVSEFILNCTFDIIEEEIIVTDSSIVAKAAQRQENINNNNTPHS